MKRVEVISIALTLIIMMVSCTVRPAVFQHPVGKTIEGKYDVYLRSDLIGYLNLKDGEYSYTSVRNGKLVPTEDIVSHFFFVQHPEGRYSLEYYDSVSQDTLLEDLGRYAVLLLIRFDMHEADRQDSTAASSPYVEDVFVICASGENRGIFFQRLAGEIQEWGVTKPWD